MKFFRQLSFLLAVLFATHVQAQWVTDSLVNTVVRDSSVMSCSDTKSVTAANGNTYIVWNESGPGGYRLKVQLLDYNGFKKWTNEGIILSSQLGSATYRYDAKVDLAGNLIVASQDQRSGVMWPIVYKLDQTGAQLWGANGIQFTDTAATSGLSPVIGITGSNNVLVAYTASSTRSKVIFQKFSPTGTPIWTDNARIKDPANIKNCERPKFVISSGEDFILQYVERTGSGPSAASRMYAQKYDTNGTPIWGSATQVSSKTIGFAYFPEPISDGFGGLYVSFTTGNPSSSAVNDVFAQRLYADGHTWHAEGFELIAGSTEHKFESGFAYDATANRYFNTLRRTNSSQAATAVSIQTIDTSGAILLGSTGVEVMSMSSGAPADITQIVNTRQGNGEYYIIYNVGSFPTPVFLRAMKVNISGVQQWSGIVRTISSANSNKSYFNVGSYNTSLNQIVVSWVDNRTSDGGVYAQNIKNTGESGINCPNIVMSPSTLPDANVTVPYSQQLSTNAGTAPFTYTLVSGTMPTGITLGSTGLISGTSTTPGVSTFVIRVTDAIGCSATQSFVLSVTCSGGGAHVVSASATPNPLCSGSLITLSATSSSTYLWSGPSGFTSTQQNPSFTATTINSGTYTVTATNTYGCSGTASVVVTVNGTPTPTASATPPVACAGTSVQLATSGGTTYSWTGPLSFASTQQNPLLTNVTTNMSGTYRVTVSGTGGCTGVTSVVVVVNPVPATKINASKNPLCSGETITLYGVGAGTYSWSTGATTPTISVSPTSNTTYTVTGSLGTCTSTASITVSVNPSPTITINPANIEICVNDTITLSGAGGVKYSWSTGATTNTIKVHPRETTTFSVTGTSANGCTGKATSTVVVKDFEAGVTASKASICEGETVTLTASGGTAYSWTPGNASGSTINVRPTVSTNYRVRITGANGCIKYLEIYIEVFPKPIVFINDVKSITPPPVCPGTEVDLRAGGAYSYLWTPDSIPGRIITVAPKTTTRYTVTGSNIWGCTSTASINIPVFAPTSARIESSTGKDPICKGKELTLTVVGLTKPVWWPGKQTTNSITMVPKDIVYAEVTGFDANGCQVTLVFEARTIFCKDPGFVSNGGRSITTPELNVTISPMPVKEVATFRFEAPTSEEMTLRVTTIDGRVIRSERIAKGVMSYELNRDNAASGMYFYQLITADGGIAKVGKVVITE